MQKHDPAILPQAFKGGFNKPFQTTIPPLRTEKTSHVDRR
ncbi:hypothetical protein ADICYQ_3063 [Cyclobacterium qasimii M12-11B]|uniref:Uncharacterized protein n=1 Tax=Cyclobacterium qasimii M12-11B TaxID=641524 RepID=S7VDB2_9BACT|nr:hypothetical protein ADICYQ_3063 [Cyclobacterium qasimii M12-11B]